MQIGVNNGGVLEVHLYELPESPFPVRLRLGDVTIDEGGIVSLYNLIKHCRDNDVSLDELLVYTNVYDEVEGIKRWKDEFRNCSL